MSSRRSQALVQGLVGVGLVLVLVAVGRTSQTSGPWLETLLAVARFAAVWPVAMHVWHIGGHERLARILFALGMGAWIRGLYLSDNALVYSLARLVGPMTEVLLVWAMLAYPTGRLANRRERALVIAGAAVVGLLWIPTMLFSERIPLGTPVGACDDACPTNVLLIQPNPDAAGMFLNVYTAAATFTLALAALALADRLRRATPLARRVTIPVLVVAIVRVIAIAVYTLSGGSLLASTAITATFCAVPLSMEVGRIAGRRYAAEALQRLVVGMRTRPDADLLREVMSDALDDPSLTVHYWSPSSHGWMDADGSPVDLAQLTADGHVATMVSEPDGTPLASLVHDPALLEFPALLDAVTSSTSVALASQRLESELAATRDRVEVAGDEVRRRIERNLHDGAQQRLIAMRMKIVVADQVLAQDSSRAGELLHELTGDVDLALAELRQLAHGKVSGELEAHGVGPAVRLASTRSPNRVTVEAHGVGRYDRWIEEAVYFCCLEALQNAARHAGELATVQVTLTDDGSRLSFSVIDDGETRPAAEAGQGTRNMYERVAELGGEIEIGPGPDGGFAVTGAVPHGR